MAKRRQLSNPAKKTPPTCNRGGPIKRTTRSHEWKPCAGFPGTTRWSAGNSPRGFAKPSRRSRPREPVEPFTRRLPTLLNRPTSAKRRPPRHHPRRERGGCDARMRDGANPRRNRDPSATRSDPEESPSPPAPPRPLWRLRKTTGSGQWPRRVATRPLPRSSARSSARGR